MKDVIRNIVAITLSLTLLVSFVGVDIYKHFCGQSGSEFISLYIESKCKSDEINSSCCQTQDNETEKRVFVPSEKADCCNKPQEQAQEIINNDNCCTSTSAYVSLNENFIVSKITIPYFDSHFNIIIKINPVISSELDCYKEYIHNILYKINQPIKLIIRFIHALSQAGEPVSHKA